jgi:hypothetical protein
MYVQGVSTRKVKAITEELCGHSFSEGMAGGAMVAARRIIALPGVKSQPPTD